jgi:hypothetical protein
MENPTWNRNLKDWEVCGVCLEVIFNTFEDAPDVTEEREEEISEDEVFNAEEDAQIIVGSQ